MSFDAYSVVCVPRLQMCLLNTGSAKCKPQLCWQLGASIQTNYMRIKAINLQGFRLCKFNVKLHDSVAKGWQKTFASISQSTLLLSLSVVD